MNFLDLHARWRKSMNIFELFSNRMVVYIYNLSTLQTGYPMLNFMYTCTNFILVWNSKYLYIV